MINKFKTSCNSDSAADKELPHWLGNFNDGLNLPDEVSIPEEAETLREENDAAINGRSVYQV